jgi:hypothetical protein
MTDEEAHSSDQEMVGLESRSLVVTISNSTDKQMSNVVLDSVQAPLTHSALEESKTVFIPEVVREPQIWFKSAPRLGSLLIIPMVIKTYLSVESLQAAVEDYFDV